MRSLAVTRRLLVGLAAVFALFAITVGAQAAEKKIKIGVIYDYTGPLAGGGSDLQALGAKIMIDHINSQGGVEGYMIEPIYADAQSKPEVAINEAVRLIEQEKVDMLLGFYSSAQCVPVAAKVDSLKKFMWITTCISPAVLKGRNLKYVFRPQVHGAMFGELSVDFLNSNAQSKLGIAPKKLRVAIIHEDGPYGSGVAGGNAGAAKKLGMNIVLKEGYSATAPDLSSLVTKLKRKKPDVILHTGYNPDITLFLRQAKEQGLRWKALIGHGAGYGVVDKLFDAIGDDASHIFNVDPVSIWKLDPKSLAPGLSDITAKVGAEYMKAKPDTKTKSAHVGMAASNALVFFADVLPRAIKKYGGIDAESLRKAALETDIAPGGTLLGYGVKFPKAGESDMMGQNMRASPVVMQYVDRKVYIAWPKVLQTIDPVLPLPKGSAYSKK
ncbi:MAG: ABC transporter substrate-binding protein [Rhodospirillaceae bacterium]|jgi:branched-chain amino acid transport system substrate-binding protein|nr:ABC transporter substrate-binding protein [Rhodospirillaceae bacterium]MBT3492626.1 ABC transporter substrate-binding protein [Rhodospirillaceae bacterium]MBT3782495.1 ABC transporter substrate-binding protein [Rhodospirillaceae bacterium]MBT3978624.1 ABC transporter substrate-binding protein [Rhodospirillaceae bacterium]MBT4167081.1 ABC transporter substrate-binding protein [Rhodospirillaceae bacterium]